jgi:hypothetical protein
LATLGLQNFSQVRALHLSDYIADRRREVTPKSIVNNLVVIDLVWVFHDDVLHPLPEHPWAGESLSSAAGRPEVERASCGRTAKTPVIPRSVQRAIFTTCEARLDGAERVLQMRDRGKIPAFSYRLTQIRDAVLYLIQITAGMRNSESVGITSGCWRTEIRAGVPFHWVRTREHKTRKGDVEFLVPPEALRALEILQKYAEPLQKRLAEEARWLADQLQGGRSANGALAIGMTVAEAVQRLNHVREIGDHLFIAITRGKSDHLGRGSHVEVMSNGACIAQLKKLARQAGTDWDLANHQCRRTFAYNVANSRLGRMGLVFLKWQLKHSSLSWTQLYCASPVQDQALYSELEEELVEARLELLEGWAQPNAPLSGGAGKKLMQTRATPARDLQQLLRLTAETVELRSTGHAWCISGMQVCHGQGVYDPTMCGGCSQAIIDGDQATTWQMIHLENLRLAAITDCGPAVSKKAMRAIERSAQVLTDLGVPLPTEKDAETYGREGRLQ